MLAIAVQSDVRSVHALFDMFLLLASRAVALLKIADLVASLHFRFLIVAVAEVSNVFNVVMMIFSFS